MMTSNYLDATILIAPHMVLTYTGVVSYGRYASAKPERNFDQRSFRSKSREPLNS